MAFAFAILLGGCGGGGKADTTSPAPRSAGGSPIPPAYAKRAEAICRQAYRKMQAVGRQLPDAFSQYPSPQAAIANGLIRPGIAILSREAADLRGLEPHSSPRPLRLFVGLFDPVVALSRKRLRTGSEAEPERGHQLELMIARLGDEQATAARKAGLTACGVNFIQALGNPR